MQDQLDDRLEPARLQIKLEEEDESLVGEYTLTVKYGLKNHPLSTGVSFSFNIAIMAGQERVTTQTTEEITAREQAVAERAKKLKGEILLVPEPAEMYTFKAGEEILI